MLVKKLKVDFKFENKNGSLIQLVHDGWKQINVLTSRKGSSRGGHFHKENEEAFYIISGSVKLILNYKNEQEVSEFCTDDLFLISAYQKHDFEFLEDTIMVSMYSLGVEHGDGTKDIYLE